MVHQLSNETDIKQAILHIGAQKAGSNIMAKKANKYLFLIKNIKTPAAIYGIIPIFTPLTSQ